MLMVFVFGIEVQFEDLIFAPCFDVVIVNCSYVCIYPFCFLICARWIICLASLELTRCRYLLWRFELSRSGLPDLFCCLHTSMKSVSEDEAQWIDSFTDKQWWECISLEYYPFNLDLGKAVDTRCQCNAPVSYCLVDSSHNCVINYS